MSTIDNIFALGCHVIVPTFLLEAENGDEIAEPAHVICTCANTEDAERIAFALRQIWERVSTRQVRFEYENNS